MRSTSKSMKQNKLKVECKCYFVKLASLCVRMPEALTSATEPPDTPAWQATPEENTWPGHYSLLTSECQNNMSISGNYFELPLIFGEAKLWNLNITILLCLETLQSVLLYLKDNNIHKSWRTAACSGSILPLFSMLQLLPVHCSSSDKDNGNGKND